MILKTDYAWINYRTLAGARGAVGLSVTLYWWNQHKKTRDVSPAATGIHTENSNCISSVQYTGVPPFYTTAETYISAERDTAVRYARQFDVCDLFSENMWNTSVFTMFNSGS